MSTIGRHVKKLAGYAPALPTPFTNDDGLDASAFERLCELQIANGATALVVCGTTGEAPNLSVAEHRELIRIAAGVSRGRVPVIAGAGSNATAHAIELSKDAEDNGADAILSVVPYYNRPTQEGLYVHFREIAASTALPLFLYDVPTRTARGLADETIARLAEIPQVIELRMPRATPRGRHDCGGFSARTLGYCQAMTRRRWASSCKEAMAVSRSRPMWRLAFAVTCS